MPAVLATCETLGEKLEVRGVTRRTFLAFCTSLTATLALPSVFSERIAHALETSAKPTLIWLEFQDCAGNTESFLRAHNPGVAELILDILSLDYHETIMAAAGTQAEAAKEVALEPGGHILVVEGSVPTADGGVYCTIAGRTALQQLEEAAEGAAAIINVGTCSSFGGIPAAKPNPTGAKGVPDVVKNVPIINLPGCPMNVDNLLATIAHYLTFGALPATDGQRRPLFAYGQKARAPSTTVRRNVGTAVQTGRSARGMGASAARKPTSGTRCRRSTSVFPSLRDSESPPRRIRSGWASSQRLPSDSGRMVWPRSFSTDVPTETRRNPCRRRRPMTKGATNNDPYCCGSGNSNRGTPAG